MQVKKYKIDTRDRNLIYFEDPQLGRKRIIDFETNIRIKQYSDSKHQIFWQKPSCL
jgi:hypothetical protein